MRKDLLKIQLLNFFLFIFWVCLCQLIMEKLLPAESHNALYPIFASIIFIFASSRYIYSYIDREKTAFLDNQKEYRSFFYANPNPLWIYDLKTLRFLEVNDAAVASYGYSRDEFLGMDLLKIRPAEDHQKLKHSLQNRKDNFYASGLWRHIKKNGEVITVSISSHGVRFGGHQCEMVMALDVTEHLYYQESLKSRYLVEKALKEELEKNMILLAESYNEKGRLADIIEKVNNIVVITDPYGVITWVNPAFSKFTGYTFQEAVGRDTSFLHGPETDDSTQAEIMNSLQAGVLKTFEILNYRKDGKAYWTDLNISPVRNQLGEITEYISIQTVITERKERERQIKEQNDALRNIAWTNSHSLRKPVASIISLAELGMEATTLEEAQEYQKLIKLSSEELDNVIREIGKQVNTVEVDMQSSG